MAGAAAAGGPRVPAQALLGRCRAMAQAADRAANSSFPRVSCLFFFFF